MEKREEQDEENQNNNNVDICMYIKLKYIEKLTC